MATFRIFIADDHEVVRKGLMSLLQAQPDWEVCGEAADGREAVDKAQQLKPDVVILDIGMPSLNGLEATRQILKTNPQAMVLEGYLKGGTPTSPVTVGRNRLTPREREIVQLLAEGKSTKEVAVALGLSVKTAETHRSNIMRKLQLHSVSDLVLYAVRNNIVHVVQAGIE